jgi:hypothetical protein
MPLSSGFRGREIKIFKRNTTPYKGGRPIMFNSADESLLERINDENNFESYEVLKQKFISITGRKGSDCPSSSTVWTSMKRLNYTTKQLTPVSSKADPRKQIEFLDFMKPIPCRRLLNCDETHNAGIKKHQARKGRSKKGRKAFRKDWFINDRRFSAFALYSLKGWVSWKIYHENCNHMHFIDFLTTSVEPMIVTGDVLLLDNASIHLTKESTDKLEEVTKGLYKKVLPNTPRLSPIERGFSQVWTYVRKNHKEAMINPEKVICDAFHEYSIMGPSGYKGIFAFICFKNEHILSHLYT